jgi:hypothetical protein
MGEKDNPLALSGDPEKARKRDGLAADCDRLLLLL